MIKRILIYVALLLVICFGAQATTYELSLVGDMWNLDFSPLPVGVIAEIACDPDADGTEEMLSVTLDEEGRLNLVMAEPDGRIAFADTQIDMPGISPCMTIGEYAGNYLDVFLYNDRIGIQSGDSETLRGDGYGLCYIALTYDGNTFSQAAFATFNGSAAEEDTLFMAILKTEGSSATWEGLGTFREKPSDGLDAVFVTNINSHCLIDSRETYEAWTNDTTVPLRAMEVTVTTPTSIPEAQVNVLEIPTQTDDAEEGMAAGVVTSTASVNIRSLPSLDGAKLGSVKPDTVFTYLGITETDGRGVDWYSIDYNGQSAWISSKYAYLTLKENLTVQRSTLSQSKGLSEPQREVILVTATVNVYTGPGKTYTILGSASKDDRLEYLQEKRQDDSGAIWYAVAYNGNAAWISGQYSRPE